MQTAGSHRKLRVVTWAESSGGGLWGQVTFKAVNSLLEVQEFAAYQGERVSFGPPICRNLKGPKGGQMGVVGQGGHASGYVDLHWHGLAGGAEASKVSFGSDFIG